MSLKKKCRCLLSMVFAILGYVSCSFQANNINDSMKITDIVSDTNYKDIISQGFMGGSLIYNEKDQGLGHLADGVAVAVRLSKAQRYDVNESDAVFQEQEGTAIYGLLIIAQIDSEKILINSSLYDITGAVYLEKQILLNKNEMADLNNDGIFDIQYIDSFSKRKGYEKSMYLTFLSSQEDLNITMYAVFPEQYPGKEYPNGIIGVNNNNKFIVQKYKNAETEQRSIITGVYEGDYIVDNKNNKYQKVINNNYARNARCISEEDLIDLENEIDYGDTLFLFTEEDFAFSSPYDFLSILPEKLTSKYSDYSGIDCLNRILEDKQLFQIIDETQGSILPENEKEEIFKQFEFLSVDEIRQLNRVFLEKNYPVSCPQRVTVSTSITEVLPLASIVFTEDDLYKNLVDDTAATATDLSDYENRAASASFSQCKNKDEYEKKLNTIEKNFSEYKNIFKQDKIPVPIVKDDNVKINLVLKDTTIALGIKGSFNSVWGSVKSSLGAAAFFKANANIGVDIATTATNDSISVKYKGSKKEAQTKELKETIPIIKKDITLLEFELCQSTNLVNFAIGPIVIGINLDLSVGLPLKTTFEMDCEISYSAYIAGLAKASVSVGVDYGITWKKAWFIKIPCPYIDWSRNASASADAICYFECDFNSLDFDLTKLALQFSAEPYIQAGLSMSVAAVVHAGCGIKFGVKGYVNFGYYKPNLKASFGLNNTSSINASVGLGLRNVKLLGIDLGNKLCKEWKWELIKCDKTLIPETTLFEYKIKKEN